MTYSCADFVDDCEQNANVYGVPPGNAARLEDCDPETNEGDALRVLAERVARAMYDREQLLAALKRVRGHVCGAGDLQALEQMDLAITEAEAQS